MSRHDLAAKGTSLARARSLTEFQQAFPEEGRVAPTWSAFSVSSHILMHERSYWYLEEAIRVLETSSKIVFTFLDFAEPMHWPIFIDTLQKSKSSIDMPINVFISREMI
jgi:hypothetical protein